MAALTVTDINNLIQVAEKFVNNVEIEGQELRCGDFNVTVTSSQLKKIRMKQHGDVYTVKADQVEKMKEVAEKFASLTKVVEGRAPAVHTITLEHEGHLVNIRSDYVDSYIHVTNDIGLTYRITFLNKQVYVDTNYEDLVTYNKHYYVKVKKVTGTVTYTVEIVQGKIYKREFTRE